MNKMITASLVLYCNDPIIYGQAISSFLASAPNGVLWVSDNSPKPLQHELFSHPRVCYSFNDANLGFGKGHNRILPRLPADSSVHLLLNPDVRFSAEVLPALQKYVEESSDVAAVMPRINYADGSLQRLCKLLPTPVDLILRRFIPSRHIRDLINQRYELHSLSQEATCEVPTLSGCCLMVRTDLLRQLGGFDERYFMYMEDVDLVRRLGDLGRTMYLPQVQVVHDYAKGSYGNRKLLGYHLRSALQYFGKWGWIFDATRRRRNRMMLASIQRD
ncbi:MAG: glycosyltransferase family 2 protein [Burkholderiales bacterium]|nr:glycosyltransferase family 2 protein [Burkholderiales bacterium]